MRLTLLLLILLALPACTRPQIGVYTGGRIADDPQITTVQAFLDHREKTMNAVDDAYLKTLGIDLQNPSPSDLVRALAAQPSESTRICARRLSAVLLRYGVASIPPEKLLRGSPTISYHEILLVNNLVNNLFNPQPPDSPNALPLSANLDIFDALIATSPSDLALLSALFRFVGTAHEELPPREVLRNYQHMGSSVKAMYARFSDPKRPLNLESTIPAAELIPHNERLLIYISLLANPTGREFRTLYSANLRQLRRAQKLFPNDKFIDEVLQPTNLDEIEKRAAELDATLATVQPAGELLQQFIALSSQGRDENARQLLHPDSRPKYEDFKKLIPQDSKNIRIALATLSPGSTPDNVEMVFLLQRNFWGSASLFTLRATLTTDHGTLYIEALDIND